MVSNDYCIFGEELITTKGGFSSLGPPAVITRQTIAASFQTVSYTPFMVIIISQVTDTI
jgi:hypothetical protein